MELIQRVQLVKSKFESELERQPRLQWMLLAVLFLVLISISKSYYDFVVNKVSDTKSEVQIHKRLLQVQHTEFSDDLLNNRKQLAQSILARMPTASSQSTAEASALAELEQQLQTIMKRSRFNLLGSEEIVVANEKFWSVRLEVSARLPQSEVINFLTVFDIEVANRRIASMQYSPSAANTVNVVVDLLYRERK